MRIKRALRTAATCILLCAVGCDDGEGDETTTHDAGGALDAGSGERDASTADSGAQTDASTADDTGTGADTGSGGDDAAAPADAGPDAQADDAGLLASSSGPWTVYADPYEDGGANPAEGITGGATARLVDGGMQITLSVSGLPPMRGFGSHLHKLACDDGKAGGHFQHMPAAAVDASTNDPAFANPDNEAWLDFTTDEAGEGTSTADVSWVPPEGGAKAIIVHDRLTGDGGVAGAKLACLPFPL